tara:strand:+ start:1869 stop:2528 length:660 start_codon:yes stop_codon:yes gene_type:complete
MKNLNEEINRIKTIISINEQCDGDLEQCAKDLVDKDYKVFSPEQLKTSCEENTLIKCVYDALDSNGITDLLISSAGESTKNCFVLAKSKQMTGTLPKIHFTFYGDSQLIVTLRLNSENGNKKLLYSGKYNCDGSSFTFGKLKYKGVFDDGKTTYENKEVVSGGFIIQVSVAESTAMNIKEGDLMMKDTFTYWLYHNGIFMRNVLKASLTDNDMYEILKK